MFCSPFFLSFFFFCLFYTFTNVTTLLFIQDSEIVHATPFTTFYTLNSRTSLGKYTTSTICNLYYIYVYIIYISIFFFSFCFLRVHTHAHIHVHIRNCFSRISFHFPIIHYTYIARYANVCISYLHGRSLLDIVFFFFLNRVLCKKDRRTFRSVRNRYLSFSKCLSKSEKIHRYIFFILAKKTGFNRLFLSKGFGECFSMLKYLTLKQPKLLKKFTSYFLFRRFDVLKLQNSYIKL